MYSSYRPVSLRQNKASGNQKPISYFQFFISRKQNWHRLNNIGENLRLAAHVFCIALKILSELDGWRVQPTVLTANASQTQTLSLLSIVGH